MRISYSPIPVARRPQLFRRSFRPPDPPRPGARFFTPSHNDPILAREVLQRARCGILAQGEKKRRSAITRRSFISNSVACWRHINSAVPAVRFFSRACVVFLVTYFRPRVFRRVIIRRNAVGYCTAAVWVVCAKRGSRVCACSARAVGWFIPNKLVVYLLTYL